MVDTEALRADLIRQTAKIQWSELQRFFAAGKVWCVAENSDLVEVAMAVATDDKSQVEAWLEQGVICSVDDDQAVRWFEVNQTLWAVVVSPWVIVQSPNERHP